jgi:hypothetical protein
VKTTLLQFLFARLREPSTIAGLGVLATLSGMPPDTVNLTAQVVAGVAGLVAVIKPDH